MTLSHGITDGLTSGTAHGLVSRRSRDIKSDRNREVGLVQVRDIVHKRSIRPIVDETQPRATSQRDDHRVDNPIDRRIRSRESLIDSGSILKAIRIIFAPIPGHPRALRVLTIHATHPSALAPPQLLQTQLRHILTGETHQVHVARNSQPHRRITHRARLRLQQPRGTRGR